MSSRNPEVHKPGWYEREVRRRAVEELVRPGTIEGLISEGRPPLIRSIAVDGVSRFFECHVPSIPLQEGDIFRCKYGMPELGIFEVVGQDGSFRGGVERYDLTYGQYHDLIERASAFKREARAGSVSPVS